MAERDELLKTLPPDLLEDASALWKEVTSKQADADPRDVVAKLHQQGKIDDKTLRKSLLDLEEVRAIRYIRTKAPVGMEGAMRILGPLGQGAMGEVHIAKEPGLNRIVAVKRLLPHAAQRPAIMHRFYTEAQVTAQLDHPGIVPIHALLDSGDGSLAYSMKLVRGRTFEDYLDEARGQWRKHKHELESHTLTARLERFLLVCDAMAYAHDKGVVHRDLKPENIMVGNHGEVIVMDWGIAKVLAVGEVKVDATEEMPTTRTTQTRMGVIMGTPRYMSPEQAEGLNDRLNGASDQYALGLILQEIATLMPALLGTLSLEQTLAWASQGKRAPMEHIAGQNIPKDLIAIIAKACAPKVEHRYPSVRELGDDVRRYLRDQPTIARPDGIFGKFVRFVGRHRTAFINLVFVLGVLGVATIIGVIFVGAGSVAAVQQASAAREQRVAQEMSDRVERLTSSVQAHARTIDTTLMEYEQMLTGLARAAEITLVANRSLGLANHEPLDGVPRATPAAAYGASVDLAWPDVRADDRNRATDLVAHRLASMSPSFQRTLLESSRPSRAQVESLRTQRTPLVWAHVWVVRDGLYAVYPGLPRPVPGPARPSWVDTGLAAERPRWFGTRDDPRGSGPILTAVIALSDARKQIGVAAVDLDAAWFTRTVVGTGSAAWLVDKEQQVLLATQGDSTGKMPVPEVVAAVRAAPMSGHVDVGDVAYYWTQLKTEGWTYIARIE